MILTSQTVSLIAWIFRVNGVFAKIRPLTTFLLILSCSLLRFVQVLATFLPLKVLLLAASDGIPSYFRFFIEPELKSQWITILALGAVGFYIISLLLERWIRWLSETGSLRVLRGANEIAVSIRSQNEASSYYAKFGGVLADALVVVVAMTLLSLINHYLLYTLFSLFFLYYFIYFCAFNFSPPYEAKGIKGVLTHNLSGFLSACSTVSFLMAFFVLLYPFVYGSGGNLLFSILAILLLRQTLSALSSVVGTGVGLWRKKFQIDPLVFRHKQLVKPEHKSKKTFRMLFNKPARERIAMERLGTLLDVDSDELIKVTSSWQDPKINGVYTFLVCLKKENFHVSNAEVFNFQHQVAPKRMLSVFEHEDFLFEHIQRKDLRAPSLRSNFYEGDFVCRIYDYGSSQEITRFLWRKIALSLVCYYWTCSPPEKLVSSYLTSQPILPARLSKEFIERASVAIDSEDEKNIYNRFYVMRQTVMTEISKLPLFVYNPDLKPGNVVEDYNGDYLVTSWGRWKLEPIGVGMPSNTTRDMLENHVVDFLKSRGLKDRSYALECLLLVSNCHDLETAIAKQYYKKAFLIMKDILDNKIVCTLGDNEGYEPNSESL